jgi:hypothetical protein
VLVLLGLGLVVTAFVTGRIYQFVRDARGVMGTRHTRRK